MKNNLIFIEDILDSIADIEKFLKDYNIDDLKNDKKTLYAVIRCFEIIGEASKNIDNEFKEKYHNLPWKEMSGLRDKLIHAYFGVDINLLWNTIKNNLPKLKSDLINIIKEQEK